jgi:DNA recombination protein RmuC
MTDNLMTLAGAAVIVLAGLAVLAGLVVVAVRALRQRDQEAAAAQMIELARLQAETGIRIEGMRDMLAGRQAELHRAVNERLDSVTHHLSQSMTTTRQHTVESLQKLNERLAVIDVAQKNITDLATQVTSLQGVLANKQQRGAFGQGRMELIVQDGLPKDCYEFQMTLSNRSRPDCAIFLPDNRPLVIDAKFPLEAVTAFREAKSDDERRLAASRVRQDLARHVGDIAGKYLIPGETQDLAVMFVPSESVF